MKNKRNKKVMAFLLAFALLISGFTPVSLNAAPSPELGGEDITPPIVSNFQFVEQDGVVEPDEEGRYFIHFTFDAVDVDGSNISAEKSNAWLWVEEEGSYFYREGYELTAIDEDSYELSMELNPDWGGKMYISELYISDEAGNCTVIECWDADASIYNFEKSVVYSEELIIDTITFSKDVVELTDDILHDEFEIIVTVKESPELTENDYLVVKFTGDGYSWTEGSLYYDPAIQAFVGWAGFGHWADNVYELASILWNGESRIAIPAPMTVSVVKNRTDNEAPVVSDVYFTANGTKLEPGAVVERTDLVEVHVVATDASGLVHDVENNWSDSWVHIMTDLQDAGYNSNDIQLTYNSSTGELVGTVPVDTLYATEWHLESMNIQDKYYNRTEVHSGNYKDSNFDYLSNYFIIRSENGTVSIPTYTYTLGFDMPGFDHVQYTVTTGRVTSLKDALASIGESVPEAPTHEGRTFLGWYRGDEVIDVDELFEVHGYDIYVAPMYDKAPVMVRIGYINENREWIDDPIYIEADYGDTVQSVMDKIDLEAIPHHPDLAFKGWEMDGFFWGDYSDRIITPYETYGEIFARYANDFLGVSVVYRNEDLNEEWKDVVVSVEFGVDTFRDALERATAEIVHSSELTLKEWNYYLEDADIDDVITRENIKWFEARAVYEETVVSTFVVYLDANNDNVVISKNVIVPAGSTYQAVYDQLEIPTDLSKEHGFKNWIIYTGSGNSLEDIIDPENAWLEVAAEYETYPMTFVYTYLTKDYETKTVTEETVVPSGTILVDYYKNLVLPEDALVEEDMYWTFDKYSFSYYASSYTGRMHGAMEYDERVPVFAPVFRIDENYNTLDDVHIYYVNVDLEPEDGDYEGAQAAFSEQLCALVEEEFGQAGPADFEFIKARHIYTDFTRFPLGYQDEFCNTLEAYMYMVYDKMVINLEYPDKTADKAIVDFNTEYVFPATHNGKELVWTVTSPLVDTLVVSGGDGVQFGVVYADAVATYADGSEGNVTPSPEVPVVPSVPIVPDTEEPDSEEPSTQAPNKKPASTGSTESTEDEVDTEAKPAVKLEETVVEEKVKAVETAEAGETVIVEMTKADGSVATEVPVAVLEAAKGKDVEIVLDMGGYSWTINGQDIAVDNLEAINLEVTLDTAAVPPAVVDTVAGGQPTRQISLTHEGDFGFKASLTINVGSENAGQFGNLYYYDSNNKLVFMNAGEIDADGNVSLNFSHASDYIVVVDKDRTTDEAVVEDTPVEDTTIEQTEAATEGDAPSSTEGAGTTDTSDSGSMGIIVIVLIVVVVAILGVVFMMKKKK